MVHVWGRPGQPPEPPKNWGLTQADISACFCKDGLDVSQLRERGWTDAVIRKYLGDHDWRDGVNHWANFTGKNMYARNRVEMAEAMPEFEVDFLASAKRRKLSQDQVAQFRSNRLGASFSDPMSSTQTKG